MAGVEVRETYSEVGETGVGVQNRTEISYELGSEIGGVWVPFASVSEHRVADFKARSDAQKEQAKQDKDKTAKAGA